MFSIDECLLILTFWSSVGLISAEGFYPESPAMPSGGRQALWTPPFNRREMPWRAGRLLKYHVSIILFILSLMQPLYFFKQANKLYQSKRSGKAHATNKIDEI